jgi:hypothetical protein
MAYARFFGSIPAWLKTLDSGPNYTNVFDLGIDPPTIFGTESLCGDWNGELLLLAKDFAPKEEVQALIAKKLPAEKIYRHNDGDGRYRTGKRTNRRLMKIVYGDPELNDGRHALTCGAVYGSACFFLKHGSTSDPLKHFWPGNPVFEGSKRVIEHSCNVMKNLKAVVCLGDDSFKLVSKLARRAPSPANDEDWQLHNGTLVLRAPHPRAGSNEEQRFAWTRIRERTGLGWIKVAV